MTVTVLKGTNLAVAFFIELVALVAFGYWGFVVGQGIVAKIGLGIGVPLLVAVVWSILGAPRSKHRLQGVGLLLLRLLVFGLATVAFFFSGSPVLGIVFGLVTAINLSLLYAWGQ